MAKRIVVLEFPDRTIEAALFETQIAEKFAANLPYQINLNQWGGELYGSIGLDLGEDDPVGYIPAGGIAYTNKGNYVCIFFGQTPAWPVEYIGQINGDDWSCLVEKRGINTVTIKENRTKK